MAPILICCLNSLLSPTHVAKAQKCSLLLFTVNNLSTLALAPPKKGEALGLYLDDRDRRGFPDSVAWGYGLWGGITSLSQEACVGQSLFSVRQCKQELHTAAVGDLYLLLEHEWQLLKKDQENGFSLILPSVCVLVAVAPLPGRAAGWLYRAK